MHLVNDTAEVLTAADLTYTGISEWFPGCGASITHPDGATLISLPKKRRTVLDVCILANRFQMLIKIDPNFEFKFGGRSFKADSEPIIMLEPAEPRSLQWFVEVMHRYSRISCRFAWEAPYGPIPCTLSASPRTLKADG